MTPFNSTTSTRRTQVTFPPDRRWEPWLLRFGSFRSHAGAAPLFVQHP